jgi:hypothetical protein
VSEVGGRNRDKSPCVYFLFCVPFFFKLEFNACVCVLPSIAKTRDVMSPDFGVFHVQTRAGLSESVSSASTVRIWLRWIHVLVVRFETLLFENGRFIGIIRFYWPQLVASMKLSKSLSLNRCRRFQT